MIDKNASASKIATNMIKDDQVFRLLGARLVKISKGKATVSLKISAEHTNVHGFCHGGIIFCLADATFGFACNSENIKSVAQHCNITYISPIKVGENLLAHARRVKEYGRSGIYDVKIQNSSGELVAIFHGHSKQILGSTVKIDK